MKLPWHRKTELDKRVTDAQDRAQSAWREAEVSADRQERIRAHVVEPLRKAAEHNQFAEMIRRTLIDHRETS